MNRKVTSISIIFILFFSTIVGFAIVPVRAASTWYVDGVNGNDGNNGSAGSPWQHIQYATNHAGSGDTIMVLPGTYNEQVTISQAVNVESAGGASVTFIDGTGVAVIDPSVGFDLVDITAAGNVLFQGFARARDLCTADGEVTVVPESPTTILLLIVSGSVPPQRNRE